jgi:hypothetical protein
MNDHGVIDNEPYKNLAGDPVTVTWKDPATGNYVQLPSYQVVNYEASFTAADTAGNALTPDQKHALVTFDANYGSGAATAGGNAAKIHRDVIESTKFARVLHETPIIIEDPDNGAACSCCVIV